VRAAVLGSPVAHSLSPVLHRAAYDYLGLADWRYDAIECDSDGLAALLGTMGSGWTGLSLTMPLKRTVLSLVDSIDPTARLASAANTVLFRGGRRLGFNTDVPGMVAALGEHGVAPGAGAGTSATILGSGATATSAMVALAELGFGPVTVVARRPDAARSVARIGEGLGVQVKVASLTDRAGLSADLAAPLVVSTLPSGVADDLVGAVRDVAGALFDVVYEPWPTALADRWADAGGTVVPGLDLLVHQAVAQVLLMTGWAGAENELLAVMRAASPAALKP